MKWYLPKRDTFLIISMILALLPACLILLQFYSSMQEFELLSDHCEALHRKSLPLQKKQALNGHFNEMKRADHFYIDKYLETLQFLQPEIKRLNEYALQKQQDEALKHRLDFLQKNNRLLFAEEAMKRGKVFQEVNERQQHPIELNEADLKKLLCAIEGVVIDGNLPPEGRPQIIIKDFELSQKTLSSQEKVYVLMTQLIKREPLLK
jgi:hypothetical protein